MITTRQFAVTIFTATLSLSAAEDTVGYNTDVRPILSDKCFFCHGPDVKENKAGLRLDTPEGAYAELQDSPGKRAVVPGSLEKSAIWHAITTADESKVMPPAEKNLALSDKEKRIIAAWIKQGAKYEPHWAFVNLPEKIEVPKIKNTSWIKNPIDNFVAVQHEAKQIEPSPEAESLRWFRRVCLDLTGLPPTIEQLDAFEKDVNANGEKAYSKAVDTLLSSKAYAENMTTPWLDAARYADTWGYHSDMDFTAWPYRDWVVRSFQDDMPYNEFVTANIAGDLIPDATRDQKLATAFNRFNRMTNEGGSDALEFFVDGVSDRVNTVGTAILGLTMECSKCHDHKYDPITAKDYFQLYAFFNSINETGLYGHQNISPPPSLLLPSEKQENELKAHQQKAAAAKAKLAQLRKDLRPAYQEWKQKTLNPSPTALRTLPSNIFLTAAQEPETPADKKETKQTPPAPAKPKKTVPKAAPVPAKPAPAPAPKPKPVTLKLADQNGFFDFDKKQKKPLQSRIKHGDKQIEGSLAQLTFSEGPKGRGSAVALDGDRGLVFKDFFKLERYTPFTVGLWIKDTLRVKEHSVILQRARGTEVGYNGVELSIENGFLSGRIYRAWPDNGIGIRTLKQLPKNQWHHLTWTYDASGKAAGLKLFLDGKPLETRVIGDRLYKSVNVSTYRPGHFIVGTIFRGRGFKGGHVDDLATFDRALTPIEIQHIAGIKNINESLKSASDDEMYAYYLANHNSEYRKTLKAFSDAQKAITTTEDGFIEVPVMEEMATPRPAHILDRGEFNSKRTAENRVKRDSFGFLLPFPKDAPRNRLGLAQWLTLPNHPLTTRVYINRIWQQFFGEGLVGTTENFGLQGDLPTHPELLDWLSRDFINNNWSTKHLVKQIALSATYRQKSALTPELQSMDISNKLLARGPSHRLSGEQIRDAALASSGLLKPKNGGKPVKPYDPINNKKPDVKQAHHRSLYSYWRRTKPQSNMIIFDKPALEVCSVKRGRTNSPAQALVGLNDPQFVEAARHLATSTLSEQQAGNARIKAAWKRVTSRVPNTRELTLLNEILTDARAYFKDKPENASKLLTVGFKDAPKEIDKIEAAAFTVLCQAIYNSDAAIWKR